MWILLYPPPWFSLIGLMEGWLLRNVVNFRYARYPFIMHRICDPAPLSTCCGFSSSNERGASAGIHPKMVATAVQGTPLRIEGPYRLFSTPQTNSLFVSKIHSSFLLQSGSLLYFMVLSH